MRVVAVFFHGAWLTPKKECYARAWDTASLHRRTFFVTASREDHGYWKGFQIQRLRLPKMLRFSPLGNYCRLSVWITCFLFASAKSDLSDTLCYFPDGKVLASDRPCNPALEQSLCCGPYWTCLDNGLCSNLNTTDLTNLNTFALIRGTCTDRTWSSDQCPQYCLNGKSV